jgi:anti-anti-sigma factor
MTTATPRHFANNRSARLSSRDDFESAELLAAIFGFCGAAGSRLLHRRSRLDMIEAVFRHNSVRRLFFPLRSSRSCLIEVRTDGARAWQPSGDRHVSSGESYYRFEQSDGCLIITLLPELNDKQWADIEKVGTEIVDRLSTAQSPRFIVDLTLLSYMGSAMVALIVRLYKAVNGRSGQMVVVNQHELVFEVLKLAGLTKLWTIVENRDKAYAALGVKRRSVSAKESGGGGGGGGNGLLVAGIIGTLGAIIGLALQFSPQQLVTHKIALLIDVGFAALGMIVGTMLLVNQTGARRNVGIALLAICLIAVLGGIVVSPEPSTPVSKENKTTTSTSSASTTVLATIAPKTTASPATDPVKPAADSKTVATTKPVAGAKTAAAGLPRGPMGAVQPQNDKDKDKDKGK